MKKVIMKILIITKHKTLYIPILCFLLFSFACSSAPSVTTPSMAVSTLPSTTATNWPISTYTPEATATSQLSATPLPTVTITPLAADLGQVIFSESFNDLELPFNVWGPGRIESGVLVVEREAGYKSPDVWPFGGVYGKTPIPAGVTTIILFKTAGGSSFNIGYHSGDYGTDALRRFSYNSGSGKWDLYQGKSATPLKSWKARQPNFGTWHYFAIKRSVNGDVDASIWEPNKPETMFVFHGNLGSEWSTHEFTFFIDYHLGSFMLDEYQELK